MVGRSGILYLLLVLAVLLLSQVSAEVLELDTDAGNGYVEPAEPLTFHAAQVGSVEVIARELADGGDVNARNRDGWTPLMFAVDANQMHAASFVSQKLEARTETFTVLTSFSIFILYCSYCAKVPTQILLTKMAGHLLCSPHTR